MIPTVSVLLGSPPLSLHLPWAVPYGSFFVELDALSAFFLLPIFLLSAVAALYGSAYLLTYQEKKSLGAPWFFFNMLVASMALVVIARNGVLFLVAWEMMALASFFLVTFEHEQANVRDAGWTYLTGLVGVEARMISSLTSVVHTLLALVFSPLLLSIINRTKAIIAGRVGQPLLQPYQDLWKLLQKGAVYSRTTTWVFRTGPVVGLASVLVALGLLAFGGGRALFAFSGDLILFAYA